MQPQRQQRNRNQPARPNLRQALAGLAREPQGERKNEVVSEWWCHYFTDPNAEAAQADQLTKVTYFSILI